MLKNIFSKGALKDVGNILQVLKDNKGRFSSKRTVAGVIVAIAATDVANGGELGWVHAAFCAIAAVIVVLAPVTEASNSDEYSEEK